MLAPRAVGPVLAPRRGSGRNGAATAVAVDDLKVTPLKPAMRAAAACLCWAPDAAAFYHLDGEGTVRRISCPDFKEEAALVTGKKCDWLCPSADGLAVTVGEVHELWLLDPVSLKVASQVSQPSAAGRAVSAPALSYAYTVEVINGRATLYVLDLKARRVVRQYGEDAFIPGGVGFDNGIVSPDGKWLFTTGDFGRVCRFALDGPQVTFGEQSPGVSQGRFGGLCLSADGQFLAAPSGGGDSATEGEAPVPAYSTAVFAANDLKKAAVRLTTGAYPTAVGFDTTAHLI